MSTDWDFDTKGTAAIEATKQWYRAEEISQVCQRMEEHKEKTRQSIRSQLTSFRPEWSDFKGLRGDLHISISTNSDPVPEAHNLFHIKKHGDLDIQINLTNPALGYLCIPVMNVFASCWKVSPEDIWNAALENKIEDARGQSVFSRGDALSAKEQALSQLKKHTPASQIGEINSTSAHIPPMTNPKPQSAAPVNPNIKRIRELEESIAVLIEL